MAGDDMSVDFGLQLVYKIVQTRDLRTVLRNNISQVMIRSTEAKEYFRFIKEYFMKPAHYGEVPTRKVMQSHFPAFSPGRYPKESIEELCELVRTKAMGHEIVDACDEALAAEARDPYEALSILQAQVTRLQAMTSTSRDLILSDGIDDMIESYQKQKEAGYMSGIPWPWDELSYETQGIHEQDFIIMFGRPKHMKSWVATKVLTHAYAAGNRRVLVYSCEMPPEQFRRRVACCLADIDYDRLRKAELTPDEEKIYFETLRGLKKAEEMGKTGSHIPSIMFTSDKDDMMGGGVSHIIAKAESFQPDLIIADSFYRMKNDRSGKRSMKWQDQYAIIQDLKHATQQLKVPIIGITQRTRSKKKDEEGNDEEEHLEDIAYADAAGQEADLIMRIKKGAPQRDGTILLEAMIAGAREIRPGGLLLRVNPSTHWILECWLSERGKRMTDATGSTPGRRPDAATAARHAADDDEPRKAKKTKRKAKRGKKKVDDDDKEHTGLKIPPSMDFDPDKIDTDYTFGDDE